MTPIHIDLRTESFRLAQAFTISRGSRTQAQVLTVRLHDQVSAGWGECVPYARYGETMDSVRGQIDALGPVPDRLTLQEAMPAGAARNALDCALWDMEACHAARPVWHLAGLAPLKPQLSAYTLSLDTPEKMRSDAAAHAHRPLLKVKLGSPEGDMPRLEAVRAGAPNARIIVDANEGWSAEAYHDLAPHMARLGVALVEQPLPAGQDDALGDMTHPVPVCADESCHDRASLDHLVGKYDMINIKLDKTGGLTEALALKAEAQARGFGIMVGCMIGSSLAMAPGVLVAQGADVTDLDAPLLLAEDRSCPLVFDQAGVHPPAPALWGSGHAAKEDLS